MALKLNINQPVQLMLSRPDPKRYQNEGRPDSYMYSVILEDGTEDKVFLSADCSQAIQELQIAARQPFAIVRRKTPAGVEFFEVQTSANCQTSRKLPAAAPAPRPPAVASYSTSQTGQTRVSSMMGAALIAAIDAAALAKQYADSKGIALEFKPEDVRCIANTLYIQACKDPPVLGSRLTFRLPELLG